MRVLEEIIAVRNGAEGKDLSRASAPTSEAAPDHEVSRPAGATARQTRAGRAAMSRVAFCVLVAAWAGAVAIVLAAALAVRLFR